MKRAAAAIPLAIAIAGGPLLGSNHETNGMQSRVAVTAKGDLTDAASALLTDEQQGWLEESNPLGVPVEKMPGSRTLIVREGYTLAHNNMDLIADWVSFHLTRDYVAARATRPGTSAFKPDPMLAVGKRAERADYKGWNNVYDQGHQCANEDSKGRGQRVLFESFLLSNMTPQNYSLNRGKWHSLEKRIQDLAAERGELWVITGPAFLDEDGDGIVEYYTIGEDRVAVPTHYYKIVLAEAVAESGQYEAMAFLVPNAKSADPIDDWLVSIDEIERDTGIDFLPALDDSTEARLEATIARSIWLIDSDQ